MTLNCPSLLGRTESGEPVYVASTGCSDWDSLMNVLAVETFLNLPKRERDGCRLGSNHLMMNKAGLNTQCWYKYWVVQTREYASMVMLGS